MKASNLILSDGRFIFLHHVQSLLATPDPHPRPPPPTPVTHGRFRARAMAIAMSSSTTTAADLPYRYQWPRPAVTVDCIIYTLDEGEPWILLIKRKNDPFKGAWALPGEPRVNARCCCRHKSNNNKNVPLFQAVAFASTCFRVVQEAVHSSGYN